jgi:6-phosphogluconolactonase/glucosamine-6-phosphate isomerase/deaminase
MQYILTAGWEDGVADLTMRLVRELSAGKRVLWLLSGGSNIPASVQIMDNISGALSQNLTVMLADERYGPPGHAESNWAQLLSAGLKGGQATLLPILQANLTLEQTVARYRQLAGQALAAHEVVIAQVGIGRDAEICGIMANSPAALETTELIIGYQDEPLTRLTLTFPALHQISAAYAFAFGKPKYKVLASLQAESLTPAEQPVQILKQLPEVYIYNDQIGEHV